MDLDKTGIYPFIKSNPDGYKLIHVKKGVNFCPAYDESYLIWYVVDGEVDVSTVSQSGRKINVDSNVEDEFTGHVSNYWGQNFYSDCTAKTPCEMLRLNNDYFYDELMKNPEFKTFFYFKMSSRLYDMFKQRLVSDLFSDTQIFAAYLVDNSSDGYCYIDSAISACEKMKMSRRNFYNKLSMFEDLGIVSHPQANFILILDEQKLYELAMPVLDFNDNRL